MVCRRYKDNLCGASWCPHLLLQFLLLLLVALTSSPPVNKVRLHESKWQMQKFVWLQSQSRYSTDKVLLTYIHTCAHKYDTYTNINIVIVCLPWATSVCVEICLYVCVYTRKCHLEFTSCLVLIGNYESFLCILHRNEQIIPRQVSKAGVRRTKTA